MLRAVNVAPLLRDWIFPVQPLNRTQVSPKNPRAKAVTAFQVFLGSDGPGGLAATAWQLLFFRSAKGGDNRDGSRANYLSSILAPP